MNKKFPKALGPTVKKWVVDSRKLIFSALVFDYYKEATRHPEQDKKGDFDILDCHDWVNVIAVLESEDALSKKLVMVEQFRMGIKETTLETPGGVIHDNEDPLMSAQRELREECGYIAAHWKYLGAIAPNPAFMSNYCHYYLATGLTLEGELQLDPLEDIVVHQVSWNQVLEMVTKGEINHSLILAGLMLYQTQILSGKKE